MDLNLDDLNFVDNTSGETISGFSEHFNQWKNDNGDQESNSYFDIKMPIFTEKTSNNIFDHLWAWHDKKPKIGLVDFQNIFLVDDIDFKENLINTHDDKILISDLAVHGNGGTATQEIYSLISKGIKNLDNYKNLRFTLSINSDFFYSIAKVRAFRFIWWRVLEENSINPILNNPTIQLISSYPEQSLIELEQNILRNFNTAMVGSILGVSEICAFAHTLIADVSIDEKKRAQRIARNMTLMCLQEAKLSVTSDPVTGSSLIDLMTEKLVQSSWDKLGKHQEDKNYYQSEAFKDEIKIIRKEKIKDYESLKKIMVGVNKYKNNDIQISKIGNLPNEFKDYYRISELYEKKESLS